MTLGFRLSSLVRAGGTTAAALVPPSARGRLAIQSVLVGGADVAAREIDPAGLQLLSFSPDDHDPSLPPALVTKVTSTASWILVNLAAGRVLRRVNVSRSIVAVLAGAAVYVLDQTLSVAILEARQRALEAAAPDDGAAEAAGL